MIIEINKQKLVLSDDQEPCVFILTNHDKYISPTQDAKEFTEHLYDMLYTLAEFLYEAPTSENVKLISHPLDER